MDVSITPEIVEEITEAIKTLNLNLGIQLESESGAVAVKWVAGYLITKQALIFLAQIAVYVFIAWVALKLGRWISQTFKIWIKEYFKAKASKNELRYREEILNRIDWDRMQEALDAWYAQNIKKSRKKKKA